MAADTGSARLGAYRHPADVTKFGDARVEVHRQKSPGSDGIAHGITREGMNRVVVPLVPFKFDRNPLFDHEHCVAHCACLAAQQVPGAGNNTGRMLAKWLCHAVIIIGALRAIFRTAAAMLLNRWDSVSAGARMSLAGLLLFGATVSGPTAAASFDCDRARSKLNRTICADPHLSRLDRTVWDAYGERIKTLSPHQYAHVRERHILWRRSRGLYDASTEALRHEYESHLAWLRHPFLPFEGAYRRDSAVQARIDVEVDAGAPDRVDLRGLLHGYSASRWHADASYVGDGEGPAVAPHTVTSATIRLRPQIADRPQASPNTCEFHISFATETLFLRSSGDCGADFGGRYEKAAIGQ